MLDLSSALFWLIFFSLIFSIAGVIYSRQTIECLEDYIVARNSQTSTSTVLTLIASSLGAWVLFAPSQAATWGGISAVIGYSLGAMAPRAAMIPLGKRMRDLIPEGHSLTEYIVVRFGRSMYVLTLIIMLFYMFITLTAEITAIAKLMELLASVPMWITSLVVVLSTLMYTSYGGLKASIFTDKVQMAIIVPLLAVLFYIGYKASGGVSYVHTKLSESNPHLLNISDINGIKAGLTFFVAILLTGLFHQGNWQRVYAASSNKSMRFGFFIGGMLVVPVIFMMGLLGLAFVAQSNDSDSSVALFSLILSEISPWFVIALIPLGLSLVMSSVDTAISAVSSIIVVDVKRIVPSMSNSGLLKLSRILLFATSIPVLIVASQGYSVLYLFLLADLLCSAAAFPVFFGMFSRRYSGLAAFISTVLGLLSGLWFFPTPGSQGEYLLESFLIAGFVPVVVSVLFIVFQKKGHSYDLDNMKLLVRKFNN